MGRWRGRRNSGKEGSFRRGPRFRKTEHRRFGWIGTLGVCVRACCFGGVLGSLLERKKQGWIEGGRGKLGLNMRKEGEEEEELPLEKKKKMQGRRKKGKWGGKIGTVMCKIVN